jgi:hypothetical protein
MDNKPWYLSKTIWVQVLGVVALALASSVPSAAAFISNHFSAVGGGWAIINIILRVITKKELS